MSETFPDCCKLCKFVGTSWEPGICDLCAKVYRDAIHADIDLIIKEE